MQTLNDKNFVSAINEHEWVLVKFGATWCPPCKAFKPVLNKAEKEHSKILFAEVDIEKSEDLGEKLIPCRQPYCLKTAKRKVSLKAC